MKLIRKLTKIIPPYAYVPLICVVGTNALTYFATRLITRKLPHHIFSLPLDEYVPLVPFFVTFYVLAFIQWIVGFILMARESRRFCYQMMTGEMIAKLICMVCFLAFPTTMVRPEITGSDIWSRVLSVVYQLDAPDNLFPSIHCLESWICFRAAMRQKKTGTWYTWASFVFTVGVCASTVLVKQHLLPDIAGGILAVEAGLFLAGKFRTGRVFERLESFYGKGRTGTGEFQ